MSAATPTPGPAARQAGRLAAIWIKRAKLGPMDPAERAVLVAGHGLVGNADQGRRRQVTLIAADRWHDALAAVAAESGREVDLDPSARRANLLVDGLELGGSVGRVLAVGGGRLRVLGETRPCERMEKALPGLKRALEPEWRGGVFAEVLAGDTIAVGDPVAWEEGGPAEDPAG